MKARTTITGAALAACIALLVTLTGCGEHAVFPPPGPNLAEGTWGGDDAGVIVTDLAAHVHIGCTSGDIEGVIPLDAAGRFTVEGTYLPRASPVVVGPPVPAEFSGRVEGRNLVLTVTVNDTIQAKLVELGPVVLEFGREPDMRMCPICRVPPALRVGSVSAETFQLKRVDAAFMLVPGVSPRAPSREERRRSIQR
jgi:hypothetical protein